MPPMIYGLPKIHKPQVPLRPIVSCTGAPSYKLSKYIASVIFPLAGKTSSHVLNLKQFASVMQEERVKEEEVLVSFDVTSLFTNNPIDEVVDVIHRKLAAEEDDLVVRTPLPAERRIAELLQLCLKSTHFSHGFPCLCCSSLLVHGVLRGAGSGVSFLEAKVLEAVCR